MIGDLATAHCAYCGNGKAYGLRIVTMGIITDLHLDVLARI